MSGAPLILDGGVGVLYFYYGLEYDAEAIEESFGKIKIFGDIYLFSCKGGRNDLASTMASVTNCDVIACMHKVSFDKGNARCSWKSYLKDTWEVGLNAWYTFSPDCKKSWYSMTFVNIK